MDATAKQLARLRELARDYGLPDEAQAYVERRITRGLTQRSAFKLIGRLGGRIADESGHLRQSKPEHAQPRAERHAQLSL